MYILEILAEFLAPVIFGFNFLVSNYNLMVNLVSDILSFFKIEFSYKAIPSILIGLGVVTILLYIFLQFLYHVALAILFVLVLCFLFNSFSLGIFPSPSSEKASNPSTFSIEELPQDKEDKVGELDENEGDSSKSPLKNAVNDIFSRASGITSGGLGFSSNGSTENLTKHANHAKEMVVNGLSEINGLLPTIEVGEDYNPWGSKAEDVKKADELSGLNKGIYGVRAVIYNLFSPKTLISQQL